MGNIEQAVERAADSIRGSRQPRFATNADTFYWAVQRWLTQCKELDIPQYSSDSRRRDQWLNQIWQLEPHWAGVLNSIASINANRGWTIVGGRNQVYRYSRIFHYSTFVAPDQYGWRPYMTAQSLSYYIADIGSINEVAREGGRNGPLRALYHVDPTRCTLTGNLNTPLAYHPISQRVQQWQEGDYFRLASMLNISEEYRGLGYSATSRALELAKLMIAILHHDQEQAGARMPEGLLILRGVREDQWNNALSARQDDLDGLGRRYFGGVFTLASDEEIDAKLVALSTLPANFDHKTFTDLLMAGYALVTGYDPSEFWPVQFGALGRGTETEMQHMKATGKGGMEFILAFQEALNRELPDTLQFEFEQRDDEGKILAAQVARAWAEVASMLYTSGYDGITGRLALATREQAMSLLVDEGIVPAEWTVIEEAEQMTDDDKARYLSLPAVQRACQRYCNEPIIELSNDGRERVLWQTGADALRRHSWHITHIERQDSPVLYQGEDFNITEEDVEQALREGCEILGDEWCGLVNAEVA